MNTTLRLSETIRAILVSETRAANSRKTSAGRSNTHWYALESALISCNTNFLVIKYIHIRLSLSSSIFFLSLPLLSDRQQVKPTSVRCSRLCLLISLSFCTLRAVCPAPRRLSDVQQVFLEPQLTDLQCSTSPHSNPWRAWATCDSASCSWAVRWSFSLCSRKSLLLGRPLLSLQP